MNLTKVDYKDTHQFSSLFLDYIHGKDQLREFYGQRPAIDSFKEQIATKNFSPESRKILCQVLEDQYQGIELSGATRQSLDLLTDPNTFTITTGHQLNIFTGPLYFIYKIVTVINICKQLKAVYPEKNFVPVYWMASEDHDFDEISYFRLNGKKHHWETDQTGAVGRFNPGELKEIVNAVPGMPEFFREAYLGHKTLADAVRYYVNELFGQYGLIAIDGDNHALKKLFQPVIEEDIFRNSTNELVESQSKKLDELGYKTQIYPRSINFFYLEDGLRNRIVKEEGKFRVLDSELEFTEEEMRALIDSHPERFSPNVVLRPVYEECVLPNLAYIGGPAEVIYWLQLKPVFDLHKIVFPIVMPRSFALIMPKNISDKWEKTHLAIEDLFLDKDDLYKKAVKEHSSRDIHLNGQMEEILSQFEKIKAQAAEIDPTLAPHVEAQQVKTKRKLENIEKKFVRAEKRHQSDRLRQVEAVLDELFPNGSPQERVDNFLNFYQSDPSFIERLITYFEPFDYRFNVLVDG
ncbi:bacillithiol biosynthesis cysteine-adding enzyme BshC [Fulvivirga ulvae]|uniref:bacillithiol biosynthesis cysteine-adding enzyme BshC n=1 Tax=Fulvivirga ulvae TaxID=2904245 RepID=UPI001F363813|nr:bacillithiol biosynthesis cysteine-adding enzyme BshC [Fulvivirga ulvae]UII33511.1 bacillithiol biosynthesis cysteine-adding enzyme BshC [Fulvivirga ulvae]